MVLLIGLLIIQIYSAEGFFPEMPVMLAFPPDGGDPGEPLFLTPYVEAGNIEEGQRLARVTIPDFPDMTSYSGFITVNKTYNSNVFFWYFPALELDKFYNPTPVMIYLQGFPGVSSLYGQFVENGPIEIMEDENKLTMRQYPWNQLKNVIYIDMVGAGFSYTDDLRGYSTDQTQVGEQLYEAVVQIFQLFPELQKPRLYLTGELYAGKFATALAWTIHQKNPTAKLKINLIKLMIGSCWCDPINQLMYENYTSQIGIHDWRMADDIMRQENGIAQYIQQELWLLASNYFQETLKIMTKHYSPSLSFYNVIKHTTDIDFIPKFVSWVQTSHGRKALHVGPLDFQDGVQLRNSLHLDFMKSVAPWIIELQKYYLFYFYNGPLGAMVPYSGMLNFIQKLDPLHKNIISFEISDSSRRTRGFLIKNLDNNIISFLLMKVGNLPAHDDPRWAWITINTIVESFGDAESDMQNPFFTIKRVNDPYEAISGYPTHDMDFK